MDWLPTASMPMLKLRAALLRTVREFFDARDYFEVDTPLLSADIVVDAWLEPFVCEWLPEPTRWSAPGTSPRYLQTSPEFAMKRLLAAGADAIYQLGKVFRNSETGGRHNPEFTMVEWYRCGDDHFAQMVVVEELVREVFAAARDIGTNQGGVGGGAMTDRPSNPTATASPLPTPQTSEVSEDFGSLSPEPFERLTYDDAFARYAGQPVLTASTHDLHTLATRHRLTPPPGLAADDRDGWLNWLLAELIEPRLGFDRPVFLWGYPATQAALAQTSRRDDGVEIAHRFELYLDGVELCNGYHELLDAAVLRDRIREQAALRSAAGLRPLPATSRLLAAMDAGLPPSTGVALGFDRLMMLAVGSRTIDDVIPFSFARA